MSDIIEADEIKWRIPDDMKKVVVRLYDRNKKFVTSYTISNYISLEPGSYLYVSAENK